MGEDKGWEARGGGIHAAAADAFPEGVAWCGGRMQS
jgi:hypothetical protein